MARLSPAGRALSGLPGISPATLRNWAGGTKARRGTVIRYADIIEQNLRGQRRDDALAELRRLSGRRRLPPRPKKSRTAARKVRWNGTDLGRIERLAGPARLVENADGYKIESELYAGQVFSDFVQFDLDSGPEMGVIRSALLLTLELDSWKHVQETLRYSILTIYPWMVQKDLFFTVYLLGNGSKETGITEGEGEGDPFAADLEKAPDQYKSWIISISVGYEGSSDEDDSDLKEELEDMREKFSYEIEVMLES